MNTLITKTSAAISPFADFADEVLRPNYLGKILKHVKGEFLVGKDGDVLPIGTQLVANMATLTTGWTKWTGGLPVDHRVGLVAEGYKTPGRHELGDEDSSKWEVDPKIGDLKDPWQRTASLVFADPDTREFFRFIASSKGSLDAVAQLSREYDRETRKRSGVLPLISLEVDAYQHPDRTIGRVKYPVFARVDYVDAGPFNALIEGARGSRATAPSPAAEPKQPRPATIAYLDRGAKTPERAPPIAENPHRDEIEDDAPF
jgi:hypothetical protein